MLSVGVQGTGTACSPALASTHRSGPACGPCSSSRSDLPLPGDGPVPPPEEEAPKETVAPPHGLLELGELVLEPGALRVVGGRGHLRPLGTQRCFLGGPRIDDAGHGASISRETSDVRAALG